MRPVLFTLAFSLTASGCVTYYAHERIVVLERDDVDLHEAPDDIGADDGTAGEPEFPDLGDEPDPLQDTDDDGLTDADEFLWGTDPENPDTDGDTLLDGEEVLLGLDPRDPDTDGDGLNDNVELNETGTDPRLADTDGDGLDDATELEDTHTDPLEADVDDDGLLDGDEIAVGSDPFKADTDSDGLLDGEEVDAGTDPIRGDTDGDGLLDGEEIDVFGTDPLAADTDDDGLGDAEELTVGTDPAAADTDVDGLDDGDELELGTDPLDQDTDDDGYSDGDEVENGTDPLTADRPGTTDRNLGNKGSQYLYEEGCGCTTTGSGGAFYPVFLAFAALGLRRRRSRTAMAAAAVLTSGCLEREVIVDGVDNAPYVEDAWALCHTSGVATWNFAAQVSDPDGAMDIIAVQAEIWDEYAAKDGARMVTALRMYQVTNDPYFWYVEDLPGNHGLDCGYGGYTVDFIAYDRYVSSERFSVWAVPASAW